MDNNFYLTTPIYYVNDKPHIGHAYTTILADVLARYHRLLGDNVFFLTGTDEHGQKVQEAAEKNGIKPLEQCDRTVVRFKELWEKLDITNDDFIRTTEGRHKKVVQKILQDLFNRDLIYKAEYKGRYCVPCERFFTEKDLDDDMLCPLCKRPTQEITENNYFFRMSNYQNWLIEYIKNNPGFIQPDFRANEVLGFLRQPLNDLCISRPKSRLSWGIELPFDKEYVCYVWFDALVNYISAIGYLSDEKLFKERWPASYHLMAKDILTTHTVYWPTMLKAMNVDMPETIFAHGYWLIGQDKMSKSLGNVVNPMDLIEKYGVDAFRYYLMADMSLGQDASFTETGFIARYNSDLANDLGNFVNRVVKFTINQCSSIIPEPSEETAVEAEFKKAVLDAVRDMQDAILNMKINRGLESVIAAVRAGNRYMEKTAPWKLAKEGNTERLNTVLYYTSEALRIISGLLVPVIPEKAEMIRKSLSLKGKVEIEKLKDWGELEPQTKLLDPGVLFPRIDVKKKKQEKQANKQEKPKAPEGVKLVSIDDFFKTELKTAKILAAEKVEKTDKLLKLKIEIAGQERQLVAGIAQYYKPEDIIGRTIIVVANLKPAKICGIESQGMLLAAKTKKELRLVTVDAEIPSGASVG